MIAQIIDIHVRDVLQHELSSVPLPLFKIYGSMRKAQQSIALNWLENDCSFVMLPESEEHTLAPVDLTMGLRMACTDTMQSNTFGELSEILFEIIMSLRCQYIVVL